MAESLLLSICIPTNGVEEWVFPVLDSIYTQNIDKTKFEVIVTDNGDNHSFFENMNLYTSRYTNLIYKKTDAYQFYNQIEAFKLARGKFIRFVNHRTKMLDGTIANLLNFINDNKEEKPTVFFSNGVIRGLKEQEIFKTFDDFIKNLSYFSSWSGGVGIWKSEFDENFASYSFDTEFPHIELLFTNRNKTKYIIDNTVVLSEIPVNNISKGKYNLFYAFAVKYPSLLLKLFTDGDISIDTFLKLKKDTFGFVLDLYYDYIIRKKPCSYDLSDYKENMLVYYSSHNLFIKSVIHRINSSLIKRGIL